MWPDRSGSVRFPRGMITHSGPIALLVLLLGGAPLQAQHVGAGAGSLHAQHTLRGQVVDTTGAGLAGVEVVLSEAGRRSVTDSNGQYTVSNIPTGRFEVVFRRLGYAPAVLFRSFLGDTGTTVLEVQLAAEAVVLPEVETKARGPAEVPVKLREWARRREFNVGGKFWDDSLLRTKEHQRLSSVLQSVSGAQLVRWRGKTYLATRGGRAGVTMPRPRGLLDTRGSLSLKGGQSEYDPPLACYVSIYLDGARLAFIGEPPNLDDLQVQQMAALEFYRSTSELPAEFNAPDNMCGVLAIWTRVGTER